MTREDGVGPVDRARTWVLLRPLLPVLLLSVVLGSDAVCLVQVAIGGRPPGWAQQLALAAGLLSAVTIVEVGAYGLRLREVRAFRAAVRTGSASGDAKADASALRALRTVASTPDPHARRVGGVLAVVLSALLALGGAVRHTDFWYLPLVVLPLVGLVQRPRRAGTVPGRRDRLAAALGESGADQ